MIEFDPPLSSRNTDALILIFNSTEEEWQEAARKQAKQELLSRGFVIDKIESRFKILKESAEKESQEELERRKVENYGWFEAIIIILLWPRMLFYDWHLRKEGYLLKAKKRLLFIGVGVITYALYFTYSASDYDELEQKRIDKIEEVDISDWEKDRVK